jgi:hypothetical protein
MKCSAVMLASFLISCAYGGAPESAPQSAPAVDRVGFPTNYAKQFQVLRIVNKPGEHKVVSVYGNAQAASVSNALQLPYLYGSIIVMESARTVDDAQGKPALESNGNLVKGSVTGLHVMRREKDFGAAYGQNRAGEWEYVEYKPDGTYITPPEKSAACAECHVKAGPKRDFVYKARLSD